MTDVVKNLLNLLEQCGEPAYKVEKDAGISITSFQGWKNERFNPSPEAIAKLSIYFGVPSDYIFGLSDDKNITGHTRNTYNISISIGRILELLNTTNEATYKVEKNAGLSNASFQAWKNGRSKPSSDSIVKLAKYFNVTTDYLLGLSDSPSLSQTKKTETKSSSADILLGKIYDLMFENDLNAHSFEVKAGLSNGSIQSWKTGKSAPSRRTLARIANAFNISEDYFYTGRKTPSEVMPKAAHTQSSNLTSQEIEMLALFRQLTAVQQGKVLGYAEAFLKNSQSNVG